MFLIAESVTVELALQLYTPFQK